MSDTTGTIAVGGGQKKGKKGARAILHLIEYDSEKTGGGKSPIWSSGAPQKKKHRTFRPKLIVHLPREGIAPPRSKYAVDAREKKVRQSPQTTEKKGTTGEGEKKGICSSN